MWIRHASRTDFIFPKMRLYQVKGRLKLVANEVVIHRNLPLSREQRTERCANTRWSPRGKVLTLREEPVKYQLVGSVMDYQGYDA